jgi:hypothetical protein
MKQINIARLRELAEKATPGPWHKSGNLNNNVIQTSHITRDVWHICACFHAGEPDAEFIAAANPQTILSLLDELEQLRKDAVSCVEFCKKEFEVINERNHKQMTGWQASREFLEKYKERE